MALPLILALIVALAIFGGVVITKFLVLSLIAALVIEAFGLISRRAA